MCVVFSTAGITAHGEAGDKLFVENVARPTTQSVILFWNKKLRSFSERTWLIQDIRWDKDGNR